jgi:integrase
MCLELAKILGPICAGNAQEAYLWPSMSENKPRMKKLVYATWRMIVKTTKLPAEMSPHDCRLSHINWIEKLCPDVSITTMKEHVGHSAIGVTEVNYTRPITPAQDLLRKSLDGLICSASSTKVA